MPIYEYRCNVCRRRVSVFVWSYTQADSAACPRCGGKDLTRLISRVAILRSEESRLEALADPSNLSGLDENDPKSMARWMRKMGDAIEEDLGEEFHEVVDRLEAGEDPESIEGGMGDVGGEASGDLGSGGTDL